MAGGLEVALACDLIVASRGARLGIPEVKRSLVAAGGALLRLPRVLPRNVAMELALTGEPIAGRARLRAGAGQPAGRAGRGGRPGARAGRGDRGQRAAGAGGDQADPDRVARLARRRVLRAPAGDRRAGDALRGRPGGRHRVRREARAGVAGAVIGRSWRAMRARSSTRARTPRPRRSPPPCARRPGRGARTGRSPATSRAPAAPAPPASVSDGPSSEALMCAGMSSSPSRVCVQYEAPSGTAWSNQASKSRRTSGEAFSFSASDAEVCWISRCSSPTCSSASSGTASTISRVTR